MYLFAYGTLMPANPQEAARDGWRADAVRGRLYDFGPYPALIDLEHPDAGWVEGFVRLVSLRELEEQLDPWEDVAQGLYRREQTITRSKLRAWVYIYQGPWPTEAHGPLDRWEGTRRAPILPDPDSRKNPHNP